MKKHYLAIAVLAVALGMTACSSKTDETAASAATEATTAAEPAAPVQGEEEEYVYGIVQEVEDKIISIADDSGEEVKFDVSEAVIDGAEAIGVGDEVEVAYSGELSGDVTKAKSVDVVVSVTAEAEEEEESAADEVISGTIEAADDKTLTLKTDDGTYTFNSIIAQKVTKDGVKAGVKADVTFYGDLEDETDKPVVTKVVTEDAKDTPEAKVNALTGKVSEVGEDYIILDTADPANTMFTFVGGSGMFDGLKAGDEATVIYQGTLTDRAIVATGLQ